MSEIAYLHAFDGLTDDQLAQAKAFYSERYYDVLDELEAIEVARDAVTQQIRERRAAAQAESKEVI